MNTHTIRFPNNTQVLLPTNTNLFFLCFESILYGKYCITQSRAKLQNNIILLLTLNLIISFKFGSAAEYGRRSGGGRQAAAGSPAAPARGG